LLISKYLPDYKLYIIETGIISFSTLFAVSTRGEIVDLKSGSSGSVDPQKEPFTNEAFSEFLKRQQIKVADANAAIETAKLVDESICAGALDVSEVQHRQLQRLQNVRFLQRRFLLAGGLGILRRQAR
jgi:hypothetical protein